MSSGDHRLDLEHAKTEPCPPPFEEDRETLPSLLVAPVPNIDLTIEFDDEDLF